MKELKNLIQMVWFQSLFSQILCFIMPWNIVCIFPACNEMHRVNDNRPNTPKLWIGGTHTEFAEPTTQITQNQTIESIYNLELE